MSKSKLAAAALLLVLTLGTSGRSAIVHVGEDYEYKRIQPGIDAAHDGDTVLVAAGTYSGEGNTNLQVVNKMLYISGEEGAEATVIDGEGSAFAGFGAMHGEIGAGTVIEGFTVRHAIHGLFISMNSDGVVVRDCSFTDNVKCGVAVEHYQPVRKCRLTNCKIDNNYCGFGTYEYSAAAKTQPTSSADIGHRFVFEGCTFDSNTFAVTTFAELRNCTVKKTQKTAFRLYGDPSVYVYDSEICDNKQRVALVTNKAGASVDDDRGSLSLYNCRIHDNKGGIGSHHTDRYFGQLHMSGCLYYDNYGKIDISASPKAAVIEQSTFVDNGGFGIHLSPPYRDTVVHKVSHNIIAFNYGSRDTSAICCDTWEACLSISCNDLFENDNLNYCDSLGDSTGYRGNISEDPLFENRGESDYTLKVDSPCGPTVSPCTEPRGWPGGWPDEWIVDSSAVASE